MENVKADDLDTRDDEAVLTAREAAEDAVEQNGLEASHELAPDSSGAVDARRGRCAISGKERPKRQLVAVRAIRSGIAKRMRADHPGLRKKDLVDRRLVNRYRTNYVEELLNQEHGEFSDLDQQVAQSIADHETISENVDEEFDEHRTLGERLSDILAHFGGSWAFLISFAVILIVWMGVNLFQGQTKAFDPYPFILLNLVLSTLAAIQAPIIMMSQRRQEEKDRLRSLNDYRVNLKAELEIRHLHDKLDHLISRQWKRLAEIQQLQLEIMLERRWRK